MPGRLGPRFALEAAFLILLAVGAGLADLKPTVIVLVMVAAWVIVAVIEFTAERMGTAFPPLQRTYVAPPPVRRRAASDLVEATVVTPVPVEAHAASQESASTAPDSGPERPSEAPDERRARRFWRRREREETDEGEAASPPRHVRLLPRRAESSRAVEEVAEIFDRADNGDDR
jgi:hypothetical protein